MFDLRIYAAGLAMALTLAAVAWVVSVGKRHVGIADALLPLLFLVMTVTYIGLAPALPERAYLILFLMTVWAVRLSLFIALRNRAEPEDRHYRRLRDDNEPDYWRKSFHLVFVTQAIIAWMVSLPILGIALGAAPLGWLDFAAAGLWLVGFGFEAIGDQQLSHFQADPANRRRVLDRGLWRYSRHPNYFGEACLWWAYFLFALSAGAWWTVLGPLLMTFLLLHVSGVPLLERDMERRRPGYGDYVRRTNAFLPGPPKPLPMP